MKGVWLLPIIGGIAILGTFGLPLGIFSPVEENSATAGIGPDELKECQDRCAKQLRRDMEHCQSLPPAEQPSCRQEAILAFRSCVMRCHELADVKILLRGIDTTGEPVKDMSCSANDSAGNIVVGKSGEEIWTDKHGRVKVQFHWDQAEHPDSNVIISCESGKLSGQQIFDVNEAHGGGYNEFVMDDTPGRE